MLSHLVLCQLLLQVFVVLQRQDYLICCILVDLFVIPLSDYCSYLIIHPIEYVVSNVSIASHKIQDTKSRCCVFLTNTHLHGGKTYLQKKLIPWQVILGPILFWSLIGI